MKSHFDTGLYALSVFVIMISFFTAFVLTNGLRFVRRRLAIVRIILSGICIGVGIWAAFIISAIAFKMPVALDIGNPISFAPVLFAIFSVLISLHLKFSRSRPRTGFWVSSFVMNLGFNGIYAFAVYALCSNCIATIHWLTFGVLAVIGFVFCFVALWFAVRERGAMQTFVGSILIGTFGAGLNILAFKAFGVSGESAFSPASPIGPVITQFYLALSLAAAAYVICSLAIVVHYNQEFAQIEGPQARERLEDKSIERGRH